MNMRLKKYVHGIMFSGMVLGSISVLSIQTIKNVEDELIKVAENEVINIAERKAKNKIMSMLQNKETHYIVSLFCATLLSSFTLTKAGKILGEKCGLSNIGIGGGVLSSLLCSVLIKHLLNKYTEEDISHKKSVVWSEKIALALGIMLGGAVKFKKSN